MPGSEYITQSGPNRNANANAPEGPGPIHGLAREPQRSIEKEGRQDHGACLVVVLVSAHGIRVGQCPFFAYTRSLGGGKRGRETSQHHPSLTRQRQEVLAHRRGAGDGRVEQAEEHARDDEDGRLWGIGGLGWFVDQCRVVKLCVCVCTA